MKWPESASFKKSARGRDPWVEFVAEVSLRARDGQHENDEVLDSESKPPPCVRARTETLPSSVRFSGLEAGAAFGLRFAP